MKNLKNTFDNNSFFLLKNQFFYWLPDEIDQNIIWIKDKEDPNICEYIAKCMSYLNLTLSDVILFERPMQSKSFLVKGTLPNYRHIHFWYRKPAL